MMMLRGRCNGGGEYVYGGKEEEMTIRSGDGVRHTRGGGGGGTRGDTIMEIGEVMGE